MKLHTVTRREFVSAAATAAGGMLIPTAASALPHHGGEDAAATAQDPVIDTLRTKRKDGLHERANWLVKPFPLAQVRLLDGPFKDAMDVNSKCCARCPAIGCSTASG